MTVKERFANAMEREWFHLGLVEQALVELCTINNQFHRDLDAGKCTHEQRRVIQERLVKDKATLTGYWYRISHKLLPEQTADVVFASKGRVALSGVSTITSPLLGRFISIDVAVARVAAGVRTDRLFPLRPETDMAKWLAHPDQEVRLLALQYVDPRKPFKTVDYSAMKKRIRFMRNGWYSWFPSQSSLPQNNV